MSTIRDIKNDLEQFLAFSATTINSDGIYTGSIFDTAGIDGGAVMIQSCSFYSTGLFSPYLLHSEDPAMVTGVSILPPEYYIGLPPVISAITPAGSKLDSWGFVSSLRYVRVAVSVSGTSGGNTAIHVIFTRKPTLFPV